VSLCDEPAHQLRAAICRGDVAAREVAAAVLDRADEVEPALHAYISRRSRDEVLDDAQAVDDARSRGEPLGALAGVPVALKDNLSTRGIETTCGSRLLRGYRPPYDATAVERLRRAGAVVLGKANMDEFAMGSSTEHSAFMPTRNPWDPARVPGGSSGGSAASVAAGSAVVALGSDTGGSIRQPAAFCGIVGLKPTYGRVSRYGLVAFASSLDQIGPLCRDVTDAAVVLGAIAGADPADATSVPEPVRDLTESLLPDVRGLRLGVPTEYFGSGVAPEVRDAVVAAIDLLAEQGARVDECSLPHTPYALDVYYVIAPSEASSNLARYDGVRFGWRAEAPADYVSLFERTRGQGFGPEVRRRIMLGTYALSAGYYEAYYDKAQRVRTLVCREFADAFGRFDALVAPTAPTVAFALGEKTDDPLAMYMNDICTIPANLAGLPAVSVPCGFVNGLPVGLQVMARPFAEGTCLRVAYTLEQATDFHRRRPPASSWEGGVA
jgi:aspartyl-tRNA(Asn)/glutamyl-tRNA(Gln) amidotransferase subunit A